MPILTDSIIVYLDFNRNPITNNDFYAKNIAAIAQSLDNLFNTERGERSYQPEYGASFTYLIGELMTDDTVDEMYIRIRQDINRWEPRVDLDVANSKVTANYTANTYDLYLVFTIKGITNTNLFAYSAQISNIG